MARTKQDRPDGEKDPQLPERSKTPPPLSASGQRAMEEKKKEELRRQLEHVRGEDPVYNTVVSVPAEGEVGLTWRVATTIVEGEGTNPMTVRFRRPLTSREQAVTMAEQCQARMEKDLQESLTDDEVDDMDDVPLAKRLCVLESRLPIEVIGNCMATECKVVERLEEKADKETITKLEEELTQKAPKYDLVEWRSTCNGRHESMTNEVLAMKEEMNTLFRAGLVRMEVRMNALEEKVTESECGLTEFSDWADMLEQVFDREWARTPTRFDQVLVFALRKGARRVVSYALDHLKTVLDEYEPEPEKEVEMVLDLLEQFLADPNHQ